VSGRCQAISALGELCGNVSALEFCSYHARILKDRHKLIENVTKRRLGEHAENRVRAASPPMTSRAQARANRRPALDQSERARKFAETQAAENTLMAAEYLAGHS
jgi:hypothetical protein